MKEVTSSVAIETSGLTKIFGRERAVDDLTLKVAPGTTLGFIGPNGAGKSTTIRMLMGLMKSSAGEARVLGVDPVEEPLKVKARVGYVPEQQFIYRWMRAGEAISFCREVYPRWDDRLCGDLTALFGLDLEKKVKQMSKGTVVKLALLLALCHEPELLILDEPMAGLDPVAREEILDGVLQMIADRQLTMLFSSHTLGDVQRMADRVAIIYQGRLLAHRSVDGLLSTTKCINVVLPHGSRPGTAPDGTIWQRLKGRQWSIVVEDFTRDSLEQLRANKDVQQMQVEDLCLEEIFKYYIRGHRNAE